MSLIFKNNFKKVSFINQDLYILSFSSGCLQLPDVTPPPSLNDATEKGAGIAVMCRVCWESPYLLERVKLKEDFILHTRCFQCKRCSKQLRVGGAVSCGTIGVEEEGVYSNRGGDYFLECLEHERDDLEKELRRIEREEKEEVIDDDEDNEQ